MTAPNGPPIDDLLLSAWLDGELDASEHARVEAWLHENPADAARVRLWAADREALRARLDAVLGEPVPEALERAVWQTRRSGWAAWADAVEWPRAAAVATLLVAGTLLGAGGMWGVSRWQASLARNVASATTLASNSSAGWVQRAALAHSVYVPEPRHAVEVKAQEEHLARWLTRRIEIPVKLFDLRDEGFDLVGGRLLPDGSGKSAQLMYENADKQRVTVYLRKPDVATDAAFRYEQRGDVGLFYWVESGAGYALVGALPKERLLALAQAIYRQHPDAASAPGR